MDDTPVVMHWPSEGRFGERASSKKSPYHVDNPIRPILISETCACLLKVEKNLPM
jgi:hypothetical protein